MGKIVVAGKAFDVEAKVIGYWDRGGYNAHVEGCTGPGSERCTDGVTPYGEKAKNRRANRYARRPALRRFGKDAHKIPLSAAQAVVRQFVLHHDGVNSAKTCFKVLHNERGLSCHFLLDNNGTV